MSTAISPLLSQSELFPVSVMAEHGCLLPTTSGLTPYAQRTIRRAINLLDKYLRQPGIAFTSSTAARDWLRLQLARQEREVFMVLYLDNQHRLLESETLFAGSVNHVQVHPREVVKSALRFNAAAVVLAHNHPSGNPEPSQCDRNITGRLKEALAVVDVNTLDHLVIGSEGIVSFAERGWI
ncbi:MULTISPECIES: RadC family protein [Enterobacterales]|uniref:RadC family protein n=1 Tax=Enterobacterales TaxID=91347 RepID=UPI00190BAB36|nr:MULTISPECIES: DNA repair protein RadC [Enterobacterales]HBC7363771.1 DNA repair protein RadC [Klebsiella oxytoca]MBK2925853.1 DNA repair protein RadC [Klebsiella pneumoniae]MBK2941678.1 DNA repair protein RadC [Klebsiella pneumoniae]MBK2946937.1 DNA repair protein RadC [Klebsiella pneumoniae]MBK2990301.1 DNA repair protein RadC [Klebsiella pneumoniae]